MEPDPLPPRYACTHFLLQGLICFCAAWENPFCQGVMESGLDGWGLTTCDPQTKSGLPEWFLHILTLEKNEKGNFL